MLGRLAYAAPTSVSAGFAHGGVRGGVHAPATLGAIQTLSVNAKIVPVGPTKFNAGGKVSLQWMAPNSGNVVGRPSQPTTTGHLTYPHSINCTCRLAGSCLNVAAGHLNFQRPML